MRPKKMTDPRVARPGSPNRLTSPAIRWQKFSALLVLCAVLQGCALIDWIGGDFDENPRAELSDGAKDLVVAAFTGIKPKNLRDFHTHIVGLGSEIVARDGKRKLCGAYVHPSLLGWADPMERIKGLVYMSASGIKHQEKAEHEYLERLVEIIKAIPGHGKYHLLAFDWHYDKLGRPRPEKSTFYMSNECVKWVTERYPNLFEAVISIHPGRPGAVRELAYWGEKGVRFVKWLPNAQGIDASDPAHDDFYRTMIKHDMILLTHVGKEKAVHAKEDQVLGNPYCFRRPLDMGLKIIMAHSASLGKDVIPETDEEFSSFQLFLKLMAMKKYNGRLFGEISALTLDNRMWEARPRVDDENTLEDAPIIQLMGLLNDPAKRFASRFVNGSDYPLPGMNVAISTKSIVARGLITKDERTYLNEIYRRNPLLFDFVLKRTLRLPAGKTDADRRKAVLWRFMLFI